MTRTQHNPPYGFSLSVNGIAFYTDPNNTDFLIETVNDYLTPSRDNYGLISYKNFFGISVPNGFAFPPDNVISWQLDDPTATALSSEALPTVLPVLSDWQSIFGLDIFSDNLGDMFLIRSDVTSGVLIPDSDGDGVPDSSDLCPGTLQGAVVNAEGCSIDQLVPCTGPASGGTWKNHGQYVSTVQGIASEFLDNGLLTQRTGIPF